MDKPLDTQLKDAYRLLITQLEHLLEGEDNFVANMANASSLLFHYLPDLNWAGFYLWDAERKQLVLGPFQGRPAGVRIGLGKGICGQAVANNSSQIIVDYQTLPGQQDLVPTSRSELVVPLRQGRTIVGILDLASPIPGRFSKVDQDNLEIFVARLVAHHTV